MRRETASAYLKAAGHRGAAPRAAGPAAKTGQSRCPPTRRRQNRPVGCPPTRRGNGRCPPTRRADGRRRRAARRGERVRAVPRADRARRSARGRNAMAIYQDLVDDHGFAAGYASVQALRARSCAAARPPEARAVIETAPGEEAQVDYGEGPMVRDPDDRQVPAHAALRADARLQPQVGAAADLRSRASRSGPSCTSRRFAASAARRASSCSTICARACSSPTSTTRRSIRSTATCSRTTASSRCRAACAIPIARARSSPASATRKRTPLKGLRFESLEEAQAYLDHWEERWADTRIHGTTKRQVAAMFAEEKPHLLPLPVEPFRYYQYGKRTVHLDGTSRSRRAYYSAPPGLDRPRGAVQWDGAARAPARSEDRRSCCASTCAQPRGRHRIARRGSAATHAADDAAAARRARPRRRSTSARSCDADPPPRRRARRAAHPRRARAGQASTAPPPSTTPAPPRSSSASPTYRFVRRYLERRPRAPLSLRQVDPLIRELTHYRDLINQKTEGDPP